LDFYAVFIEIFSPLWFLVFVIRSGVTIENPPVKDGEALITSIEFATRKYKTHFYNGQDATRKERGDFRKHVVESDEKFRKDI
jgi:hypothetical protein